MTKQYLGKQVRELPKRKISWKERLRDMAGWIVFGVLIPLYSLGSVFILFFLLRIELLLPFGNLLFIASLVPALTIAIASPLSWKLFKAQRYKAASDVLFGSAILFALLDLLLPLILFFPPSISNIVPFLMGSGFYIVIFLIIGYWLRKKQENENESR